MKTKRFTNKKIIALSLLVALFVATTLFALERLQITDFVKRPAANNGPSQTEIKAQEKAADDAKKEFIEQDEATSSEPGAPPTSESINLSAQQDSTSTVTVLTKLQGFPDGECSLLIQNGSKSTTKTAPIIYQPEFSSCAGFSINKSELGSGIWNITLTAKTSSSDPVSKSIDFEVN